MPQMTRSILGFAVVAALACGGGSNRSSSLPTAPPSDGGGTGDTGGGTGGGSSLASCTIDFDNGCPNSGSQCGATFAGGRGCRVAGLAGCYDTGSRAYEVTPGGATTVDLEGDLDTIDVFFAAGGNGSGEMRFLDADGTEVASLSTNGDCTAAMPPTQRLDFSRPVRSIELTSTGGSSWIDTMQVNP